MQKVVLNCMPIDFSEVSDEVLVQYANDGNVDATEFLLKKYRGLVKQRSRAYYLIGADHEDIVQEGMIGLYKAIRDFNADKQVTFRAFAEICVMRQIITAIKTATRQKHFPLNTYVSLNRPLVDDDYETTLLNYITDDEKITNPESIVLIRERSNTISAKMGAVLSVFECKVLREYLRGVSYVEISKTLNRNSKSIDNAIQRIKRKLEKLLIQES